MSSAEGGVKRKKNGGKLEKWTLKPLLIQKCAQGEKIKKFHLFIEKAR